MSDGQAQKTQAQSALVEDFRKFRREPSPETRAALVGRICDEFNDQVFANQEKVIVREILEILSRDVERTIRQVLAEKLKSNKEMPREVAFRLAQDVVEISTPVLQFSEVLTDEDLEAVISSSEETAKLMAIARRETVSERVSKALVDTDSEEVVVTLVENKGAAIPTPSLERVVEVFKQSGNVLEMLVKRGGLPVQIAERMVSLVSVKLQKELVQHYKIAPQQARQSVQEAREDVTLDNISRHLDRNATQTLVNELFATGRLSHSMVLRALCRADLGFFEAGLARLASVPIANASKLLASGERRAFDALYKSAHLPPTMPDAAYALMRLIHQEPPEEGKTSRAYFSRLIGRIMGEGYDHDIPNMQYFLTLINEGASASAASHAQTTG